MERLPAHARPAGMPVGVRWALLASTAWSTLDAGLALFGSLYLAQGGGLLAVALYHVALVPAVPLVLIAGSGVLARVGTRAYLVTSAGALMLTSALFLVLGTDAVAAALILAAVRAAGSALYSAAYEHAYVDLIPAADRVAYNAVAALVGMVAGTAVPLAGALVLALGGAQGYTYLFAAFTVLAVVVAVALAHVPDIHPPATSFQALRSALTAPGWRSTLILQAARGGSDFGWVIWLNPLVLLAVLGSDALASAMRAYKSVLIGIGWALSPLLVRHLGVRRALAAGALVAVTAHLLTALTFSPLVLVLTYTAIGLLAPTWSNAARTVAFMPTDDHGPETRYAYVIAREVALALGRLVAGAAVIAVALLVGDTGLRAAYAITILGFPIALRYALLALRHRV